MMVDAASRRSLPETLAMVPPLQECLLQTWETRNQGIKTLCLVNRELRDMALRSVESFSVNLKNPEDFTRLALLMKNVRPPRLCLTLSTSPAERLEYLLGILGPAVRSIKELVMIADTTRLEAEQREAAALVALTAISGLLRLSLGGSALLSPPCMPFLKDLTELTVTDVPVTVLRPLLLCLSGSRNLQVLDMQFKGRNRSIVEGVGLSLPSSVTELRFNGTVSPELTADGFLKEIRLLTLDRMPARFKTLNHLRHFAPRLENLVLTCRPGAMPVIPDIMGTAELPDKEFQLTCGKIALYGSTNDIRDVLARVTLRGVEKCHIVLSGANPEIDPSFLTQFSDKCPEVQEVVLSHYNRDGSELGYLGNEGFLLPLAACSNIKHLQVSFSLPGATREGLSEFLSSMPALVAFTGVKSSALDLTWHGFGMAAMRKVLIFVLKEQGWVDAEWLWSGLSW